MYPTSDIWLVGHSLGGALASLLGTTFGLPAVAFEAPGERLAAARRLEAPYRDRRVRVRVELTPAEARYEVADEGPGFDVSKLPDPTDPANLERPSGRGVLFMRTFIFKVRT